MIALFVVVNHYIHNLALSPPAVSESRPFHWRKHQASVYDSMRIISLKLIDVGPAVLSSSSAVNLYC